jgi:hypothetical protein
MEPKDPQSEGQAGSGLGGPRKSQLTAKRILAVMLGVAVLAAIAGIIANLGSEPELSLTPTTLAEATRPPSTEVQTALAGHQIPPIDGCTLISDDEILSALGVPDDTGFFRFSGGEGCVWQPDIGDEEKALSVELGPGSPSDFETGATINDATGVPVPSVGDVAVWFGSDGAGTLSAVRQTDIGFLFMRLAINRPDVNDQVRLRLASSLITSAMDLTEFGPPPPVEADLCELVTDDEAEGLLAPHREGRPAARDPLFVLDNFSGPVDLSQMGEFSCTKLIFTEIYVTVESASETDFGDDANIDGVPGEQVAGVGDVAMWFEDVPRSGPFAAPHEIDVMAVGWEDAKFRIVIALPDLAPDEQFETAKELARKALARLPGGPGELIIVEREVPDLSNMGFVDNLLAREKAGEWTLGEGLVATLKLFSGELDAASVLRHDELLNYEGTGIFAMANQYLMNGPDAAARAEIARLLDLLVFSNEQLEAMAGIGEVSVMAGTGPLALGVTAGAEEDCTKFFSGWAIPLGVGKCLEKMPPSFYLDEFYTGDYAFFAPAPSLPQAGWEDKHYRYAAEAMEYGVREFDEMGKVPPVSIVFAVKQDPIAGAVAAPRFGPGINEPDRPCGIALFPVLQGEGEADFKQFVAHELAHCFQGENFKDQVRPDPPVTEWREEGLAEYLSNVVYPKNDLESREFLEPFADQEMATTVVNRAYQNFIFFQFLFWEIGNEGIFNLVRQLPDSGGKADQMDGLASIPGMAELYHEFAKDVTDEKVRDTETGPMRHEVRADKFPISGPIILLDDPQRFGVVRLHLVVDPGKYACVEYQEEGELRSSWREGEPGAPGGSWSASLPDSLQGEAVFVVTATEEKSKFTVEVTDVSEDPECEEEEEEAEPPPEPCLCDPSAYFLVFQDIPDILKELFSPSG